MAEVDFKELKKSELVDLVIELQKKAAELEAAPDTDGDSQTVQGLINIGGLWADDPQGKKYLDKNGKRIWVGEVRHRVLMTINGYKSSDNRQPNLRLSVMPYRAQQDNSEDVGELDGEDAETPF